MLGSFTILKRQAVLGYPTFPVILWAFRVLVECLASILACSLTHGTHMVHQETFFENLPTPSEPSAAFFGNSRSLAAAQCESVSRITRRLATQAGELERNTQFFQYSHLDLHGSFQVGILPLVQKELIRRIAWFNNRGIKSQICISINSQILWHFSVGKRAPRPRCVPVQTFPRKLCCGSNKWRWSNQWTILRRRDRLEGIDSEALSFFMRRLRPLWRRSSRIHTSRRKSVWRSKRPKWKTDRVWDLRVLSGNWSTWSWSWLNRSIQCHCTRRRYSRFWYQMGPGSAIYKWGSQWQNSGKFWVRCGYESLINSKQYGLCTNKKSNKIYRGRFIRSWRPV